MKAECGTRIPIAAQASQAEFGVRAAATILPQEPCQVASLHPECSMKFWRQSWPRKRSDADSHFVKLNDGATQSATTPVLADTLSLQTHV